MALDDKDRLSIFDKNGPYLATKKVGKNNPKSGEIKADNEIRMEWNRAVDRAIVSGVSEAEVLELKKTEIMDRVKKSETIVKIIGDDYEDTFELKARLQANWDRLQNISYISRYVIQSML